MGAARPASIRSGIRGRKRGDAEGLRMVLKGDAAFEPSGAAERGVRG